MFDNFITWFKYHVYPGGGEPVDDLRETGVRVRPPGQRPDGGVRPAAHNRNAKQDEKEEIQFDSEMRGRIEDAGPGKNVLMRSKYVREDAGTHDQLKIIGEETLEVSEDADGIDPYNTGRFDRGKSWNNRSRK